MKIISLFSRFVLTMFVLLSVAVPARSVAEQTTVGVASPDPARQIHDSDVPFARLHRDLQTIDRRLRQRLLRLTDERPAPAVSADEIQRFRRHLRALEARLHAGEGDEVAALIRKVRALRPLVDNLERAAKHQETAAAGLGLQRKALRVEWPPAPWAPTPGLKAGVNDDCAGAIPIGDGTYFGDTSDATPDGGGCFNGSPDVWFAYSSPVTTEIVADTFGSGYDTVLSVYTGCPGTWDNEIACNDDVFGQQSAAGFLAQAGEQYLIRVSGSYTDDTGPFTLNVGSAGIISGEVTDAMTGEPVADVWLEVTTEDDYFAGSFVTGPDGTFVVAGLATGSYFVHTENAQDYLPEVYDGRLCDRTFGCRPTDGTPIAVVAGTTTGGIDFTLETGGTISGTVTESATGDPLPVVGVHIWDSQGNEQVGYAYSSPTGHYSFAGLHAGTYYARTDSGLYRDELYDDISCPAGSCDPTAGEPIEVSFGATTGGVDFALEKLGVITGTVSDSVTGFPIQSSIIVNVWDAGGQNVKDAYVDSTGAYQVGGLATGNYFVTTDVFGYFDELYDDLPCEPGCDPTAGVPIAVSLNSTTSGIDFALERLGAISGNVTRRTTGEPISANVYIWDSTGTEAAYGFASSGGNYLAEGLLPGTYTATVEERDYQGELYDDLPCPNGDCDRTSGTPIEVSLNTVTPGVDFALDRLAAISGRVTHSLTGQPVGGAVIDVHSPGGLYVTSGFADASGHYLAEGLDPGTYVAFAHGYEYRSEVYQEMPCTDDGCDLASATPIEAMLNTVTGGVDFTLDRLGFISGHVSHAGQPVFDAHVSIYDSSGFFRRSAYSDSAGNYTVSGLEPGSHFALVDYAQLDSELYDDVPCEDGCDPTSGTPIAVNLNTTTPGIDFDLVYCTPTATSLCLTGDRFRVEATWEDFQNVTGPGHAEGLTADAGYFWFFTPGNIELVVKVLDVCIDPHNRFWVFGAGLTDVGVELTVTDEATGEVRSYANPLGTTYQPVLDTLAFSTCDASLRTDAGSAVAEPPPSASLWQPLFQASPKTMCVPSATSLCLDGGRFLAELIWEAPNGNGGPAPVVQLTDESGYFWFGSADNVEVVVKVLDACNLAPFNNYWVFAAGLTNFEVTLRVTDTETGELQEYFNPQGTTFQAITDTGAFDTCTAP